MENKEQIGQPKNLKEAIEILKDYLPEEDKSQIKEMTEKKFLAITHHGLGMWLRNKWGLWKEDTEINQWFNEVLEITHADDMSGIILASLYRHLHGAELTDEALGIDAQVKKYHDHWEKYKPKE